jgi:nucleotide-binding universal stress UspA family protein
MPISRILLCVDGEPHTEAAVGLALELAKIHGARLDGLYVVDPFLKKFTNEIYAVNRNECREHLDRSLAAEGEAALDRLCEQAAAAAVVPRRLLEYGPPEEIIPRLAAEGSYDLIVLGGKRFAGRYERWTSRDLPSRLDCKLAAPVLLARV